MDSNIEIKTEEIDKKLSQLIQLKNKNIQEQIDKRYPSNIQIIKEIIKYIKENKNQRFIQALWNLDIINTTDRYSEESTITLKRIQHKLEQDKRLKENINNINIQKDLH